MRRERDEGHWTREPWPWILMSGPALVVIAGLATAALAVKSSDGLVADDYYKQGLAVNQRLQRDHQAQALGVHAELMRSGLQLRVWVTPVELTRNQSLVLNVAHPTRAGADFSLPLHPEGGGMFTATLPHPLDGRWYVSLEDADGGWRLQGDWKVGTQERFRLGSDEPSRLQ